MEVRDSVEVNKTLSKLGYTIIPESAVCMVRKITSTSNPNWLNDKYSKCDGHLKIFGTTVSVTLIHNYHKITIYTSKKSNFALTVVIIADSLLAVLTGGHCD